MTGAGWLGLLRISRLGEHLVPGLGPWFRVNPKP